VRFVNLCNALRRFVLFAALVPALATAQNAVEITGQVHKLLSLSPAELKALPRKEYSENRTVVQDGKEVTLAVRYQGVPLRELIDRAGLKPDRREIRKAVVLLTARDGYQASFSWGELYNSALGDGVIVVMKHGNDELVDTEGLPSVRSLQDTRPGPRHVRWLAKVEVLLPK
jgi:hypothetical protein